MLVGCSVGVAVAVAVLVLVAVAELTGEMVALAEGVGDGDKVVLFLRFENWTIAKIVSKIARIMRLVIKSFFLLRLNSRFSLLFGGMLSSIMPPLYLNYNTLRSVIDISYADFGEACCVVKSEYEFDDFGELVRVKSLVEIVSLVARIFE